MNVLIVTNGDIDKHAKLKRIIPEADFIICADGGIKHLSKLGLWPDLIVGDFDSAKEEQLDSYIKSGVKLQRFSSDKDETDTHIAVDYAIKAGATSVTLLGALGSRFDHSYANIMLLYRLMKSGINARIIDNHNHITLSAGMIEIERSVGQLLSILPFGGEACISETQGLKYPIINRNLPLDEPYGISNVFSMPKAIIRVKSGWVLVIMAWD
jgi:thiamine pyrophosphokinase